MLLEKELNIVKIIENLRYVRQLMKEDPHYKGQFKYSTIDHFKRRRSLSKMRDGEVLSDLSSDYDYAKGKDDLEMTEVNNDRQKFMLNARNLQESHNKFYG